MTDEISAVAERIKRVGDLIQKKIREEGKSPVHKKELVMRSLEIRLLGDLLEQSIGRND